MATYGNPSVASITQNLDTVLTLAFANSGDAIADNISKNNAVFYELKKAGGTRGIAQLDPYIEIPLRKGLGNAEWYQGWDTLGTQPTDNVTAAQFDWKQLACPAGVNRREMRVTSAGKVKEIVQDKIDEAQLTMTEAFNRALLQGNVNAGGNIYDPIVSGSTSRTGIEPLPRLVYYQAALSQGQVTTSLSVGGINQATYSFWRNWSHDMTGITTYAAFLAAMDQMYENTTKGPGGGADLIVCDHATRSLWNSAYYQVFRRNMDSDNNYPFDNLKFRNARIVCDELIPNVHSNTADTSVSTGLGSAFFLNTKFMGMRYDTECNFVLTDMQKPVNQDGKVGHVMWMGNTVINNRRKFGVVGDIPRTLA